MRFSILLLGSAMLVIAGGAQAAVHHPAAAAHHSVTPSDKSSASETERLNAWFDARNDEMLKFSPMARSGLGDKRDYDKIDDMSEEAGDRSLEWQRMHPQKCPSNFDLCGHFHV